MATVLMIVWLGTNVFTIPFSSMSACLDAKAAMKAEDYRNLPIVCVEG